MKKHRVDKFYVGELYFSFLKDRLGYDEFKARNLHKDAVKNGAIDLKKINSLEYDYLYTDKEYIGILSIFYK